MVTRYLSKLTKTKGVYQNTGVSYRSQGQEHPRHQVTQGPKQVLYLCVSPSLFSFVSFFCFSFSVTFSLSFSVIQFVSNLFSLQINSVLLTQAPWWPNMAHSALISAWPEMHQTPSKLNNSLCNPAPDLLEMVWLDQLILWVVFPESGVHLLPH